MPSAPLRKSRKGNVAAVATIIDKADRKAADLREVLADTRIEIVVSGICKYQLLAPLSASEGGDLLAGKTPEDGMRRMQALLADWLRMENVVVLTAAGTSVGAGGRLMSGPMANNLEGLVIDAVQHCPITDAAKTVLAWKKANDFGKGKFEEWLSYLFNASGLLKPPHSPLQSVAWKSQPASASGFALPEADEKTLRGYIEKAIFAECALEIDRAEVSGAATTPSSGHIPFIAKLIARDTNLGRTHLFTLNYDTLFEQAMEELGVQYFDGFSGRANPRFEPATYGLDVYYPGDVAEGRVRRFDKFVQFYKLHGSIHWYTASDGTYHARHRDLAFARAYRTATPEEKAKLLETADFRSIESFGILPTSQKFSKTLDNPYAHLFRLFHARLNQPQTFLIVAGYGFADDHVTRIIETALTNPSLVMLVIEPNPASAILDRIKRYQGLGQRPERNARCEVAGGLQAHAGL
jgi:hypothetical protein